MTDTDDDKYAGPWCVSVYEIGLRYGGSEEGGWWYTEGYPDESQMQHLRIFNNEQDARAYRDKLEAEVIPVLNEGRPPLHSVLSTAWRSTIIDEHLPRMFPDSRPYYE